MSVSTAIILSLAYIVVLLVATFYNHLKDRKDLFTSAAFVFGMYLAAHLGNTLWLMSLPISEVLGIHYLYFATFSALTALGLFLLNKEKLRVIMSITIGLLFFEALLGYAIHIDRNIMALNGAAVPNASGTSDWLLWNMVDIVAQFNSVTVIMALTMSNIYQVRMDTSNTDAFEIMEDVERYVDQLKPGIKKVRAQVFLEATIKNLFEPQNSIRDKLITSIGITILNEAIRESCYEPKRTKPVSLFGRFVYWLRS